MGHSRHLFRLFSSFQTNVTIFTTIWCEKCPSSIWCLDLKPQPLECESPPIITRPGTLSNLIFFTSSSRQNYVKNIPVTTLNLSLIIVSALFWSEIWFLQHRAWTRRSGEWMGQHDRFPSCSGWSLSSKKISGWTQGLRTLQKVYRVITKKSIYFSQIFFT